MEMETLQELVKAGKSDEFAAGINTLADERARTSVGETQAELETAKAEVARLRAHNEKVIQEKRDEVKKAKADRDALDTLRSTNDVGKLSRFLDTLRKPEGNASGQVDDADDAAGKARQMADQLVQERSATFQAQAEELTAKTKKAEKAATEANQARDAAVLSASITAAQMTENIDVVPGLGEFLRQHMEQFAKFEDGPGGVRSVRWIYNELPINNSDAKPASTADLLKIMRESKGTGKYDKDTRCFFASAALGSGLQPVGGTPAPLAVADVKAVSSLDEYLKMRDRLPQNVPA